MRSISSTGGGFWHFIPGKDGFVLRATNSRLSEILKMLATWSHESIQSSCSSCKIVLLISTLLHLELRACCCRSISNLCLSRMIMEAASRAVVLERYVIVSVG